MAVRHDEDLEVRRSLGLLLCGGRHQHKDAEHQYHHTHQRRAWCHRHDARCERERGSKRMNDARDLDVELDVAAASLSLASGRSSDPSAAPQDPTS